MSAGETSFAFESIDLPGGWSGRLLLDRSPYDPVCPDPAAAPSRDEWRAFLTTLIHAPDALPDRIALKQSHTAQVFRTHVAMRSGGLEVVCKRSIASGRLDQARRLVRGSREARNFARGLMLLRAGIRTARPRAVLRGLSVGGDAWLITETIPDAIDLDGLMSWQIYSMDRARAHSLKRALAVELAALCRNMARHRVAHRDFKASNILVTGWKSDDAAPFLWLVDLDGVARMLRPAGGAILRSVTRLAASLADQPSVSRADFARFLHAFHSDGPSADWRASWRRIARASQAYNQRARRRKTGKLDGFDA